MTTTAQYGPLDFERLSPDEQLARSREFLARMQARRTVRDFSSAPVPFELIANAIATAATAPSGANQQPWTFAVVSDPAIKRRIREAAEIEERESYEHRMSDEWLAALAHLGTDWHKPHLEIAPYLIVVFLQAYGLETDERRRAAQDQALLHQRIGRDRRRAADRQPASGRARHADAHAEPDGRFSAKFLSARPTSALSSSSRSATRRTDAQVPVITKKPLDEVMIVYGDTDRQPDDAPAIAAIYNQGIEDRVATFETRLRSATTCAPGSTTHAHPIVVVTEEGSE